MWILLRLFYKPASDSWWERKPFSSCTHSQQLAQQHRFLGALWQVRDRVAIGVQVCLEGQIVSSDHFLSSQKSKTGQQPSVRGVHTTKEYDTWNPCRIFNSYTRAPILSQLNDRGCIEEWWSNWAKLAKEGRPWPIFQLTASAEKSKSKNLTLAKLPYLSVKIGRQGVDVAHEDVTGWAIQAHPTLASSWIKWLQDSEDSERGQLLGEEAEKSCPVVARVFSPVGTSVR